MVDSESFHHYPTRETREPARRKAFKSNLARDQAFRSIEVATTRRNTPGTVGSQLKPLMPQPGTPRRRDAFTPLAPWLPIA